jgi:hypothetical protein
MNPMPTADFTEPLAAELRAFLALCEEALALAACESRALSGALEYQPQEFSQRRNNLLPSIKQAAISLAGRRITWQQIHQTQRLGCAGVNALLQSVQDVLMKFFILDRENQQAMLRRGLVPARHLPTAAAQRPHFVAGLYQKHSTS